MHLTRLFLSPTDRPCASAPPQTPSSSAAFAAYVAATALSNGLNAQEAAFLQSTAARLSPLYEHFYSRMHQPQPQLANSPAALQRAMSTEMLQQRTLEMSSSTTPRPQDVIGREIACYQAAQAAHAALQATRKRALSASPFETTTPDLNQLFQRMSPNVAMWAAAAAAASRCSSSASVGSVQQQQQPELMHAIAAAHGGAVAQAQQHQQQAALFGVMQQKGV